jgi:hypothetical protein
MVTVGDAVTPLATLMPILREGLTMPLSCRCEGPPTQSGRSTRPGPPARCRPYQQPVTSLATRSRTGRLITVDRSETLILCVSDRIPLVVSVQGSLARRETSR